MRLDEGIGYRSDQGIIWNELEGKAKRMAVRSDTGAMAEIFAEQRDRLGEYLKAFRLVECQLGAAFAINGKVVGLECFCHRQTFEKFLKKLVQSYALDALDWPEDKGGSQAKTEDPGRFLEGLQAASGKSYPSLGLGENVRFEDHFLSGAALVHEGRVLHLSAFSRNGQKNEGETVPSQRFSQRRNRS